MLKFPYFDHMMQRSDSLEKTLMLAKAGGGGDDRGWDGWMASLTRWTRVWANSRSWCWTGKPGVLQSWGHKESDMTEWLIWTEVKQHKPLYLAEVIRSSISVFQMYCLTHVPYIIKPTVVSVHFDIQHLIILIILSEI